jgi:lipoprotein-releasing system permease protein
LFSKKSKNIINLISIISMGVVAFVTAAMIIVLSAFSGIEELVKDLFSSFDAPFTIVPERGKTIPDSLLTAEWLESIEGLGHYSRIIEEDAWISNGKNNVVATIKGVEDRFTQLAPFDSLMYSGVFALEFDGAPSSVIGQGIRMDLDMPVDPSMPASMRIHAPVRGKKLSRYREQAFRERSVAVSGAYTANAELDHRYVFVSLPFARELFGMDSLISSVELMPAPGTDEVRFHEALKAALPDGLKILTRYDRNALVYRTNRSEKWATFLILVFILIIASFNIIASLTMLIIEKKKDIYVLGSMGMTKAMIRRIFTAEGVLINLTGATIGTLLGLLICLAQQHIGIITMQGGVVEYYPVHVNAIDIAGIFATVTVLGSFFCIVLVRTLLRRFAWNEERL